MAFWVSTQVKLFLEKLLPRIIHFSSIFCSAFRSVFYSLSVSVFFMLLTSKKDLVFQKYFCLRNFVEDFSSFFSANFLLYSFEETSSSTLNKQIPVSFYNVLTQTSFVHCVFSELFFHFKPYWCGIPKCTIATSIHEILNLRICGRAVFWRQQNALGNTRGFSYRCRIKIGGNP